MSCVGYAPPQTMDPHHARLAGEIQPLAPFFSDSLANPDFPPLPASTTVIVLGDDIVPRFSLRSTLDLSHRAMELGRENNGARATGSGGYGTGATTGAGPQTATHAHNHIHGLRPPGRIVHLNTGIAAALGDQEDFAAIKLSRKMLVNHMWPGIMQELGRV